MKNDPPSKPGHESTDIHTRGVWIAGLGIAVSCLVIALIVTHMFNSMRQRAESAGVFTGENTTTPSVGGAREQYPGPRQQVAPGKDLAAFRASEEQELNGYGWVDKKAGVVRIPVERAMDLLAQRGLPVNGHPGAPAPYRTELEMQQAVPRLFPSPAPTATPWINPTATPMGAPPSPR
ncbi:MAG TPA: hypothetical protein VG733_16335 [Chthoniobacteraceae bacterium]|nr:hypothetical protein [Chthoniobacteraceae bacterium]